MGLGQGSVHGTALGKWCAGGRGRLSDGEWWEHWLLQGRWEWQDLKLLSANYNMVQNIPDMHSVSRYNTFVFVHVCFHSPCKYFSMRTK